MLIIVIAAAKVVMVTIAVTLQGIKRISFQCAPQDTRCRQLQSPGQTSKHDTMHFTSIFVGKLSKLWRVVSISLQGLWKFGMYLSTFESVWICPVAILANVVRHLVTASSMLVVFCRTPAIVPLVSCCQLLQQISYGVSGPPRQLPFFFR